MKKKLIIKKIFLKGKLVEGQKLLIKYPDNPNTSILNNNPQKQTIIKNDSLVTTASIVATNINKNTTILKQQSSVANNKAINNNHDTIILTKSNQNSSSSSSNNNINTNNIDAKLTGPVNGNECYFWRTTGCVYADKCRYLHLSKSKGIDKKPWHKAPI
jgi:hypothetical protein